MVGINISLCRNFQKRKNHKNGTIKQAKILYIKRKKNSSKNNILKRKQELVSLSVAETLYRSDSEAMECECKILITQDSMSGKKK